jgi:hypothetical protein
VYLCAKVLSCVNLPFQFPYPVFVAEVLPKTPFKQDAPCRILASFKVPHVAVSSPPTRLEDHLLVYLVLRLWFVSLSRLKMCHVLIAGDPFCLQ